MVQSAMLLVDLLETGHTLAREVQEVGPQLTNTAASVKEFLSSHPDSVNEKQISGALLFMALTPQWQEYSLKAFVLGITEVDREKNINWQSVVKGFDRNGLSIIPEQFVALYNCLSIAAQQRSDFDIQVLCGAGEPWSYPLSQLAFVLAFASLPSSDFDATTVPGLRQAYDPTDCADGSEEMDHHIHEAQRDTMILVDAVATIYRIVWNPDDPFPDETAAATKKVIESKMGLFLCSSVGTPKPWSDLQQQVMTKLLASYLFNQHNDSSYVLRSLWKQDKQWVATRLFETHIQDPLTLSVILEHAQEQGWLEDLTTLMNGFGIDLAALAHRQGLLNIEEWASDKLERNPNELISAIIKFLILKAEDESRSARGEQEGPKTIPLTTKTASAMLRILDQQLPDRPEDLLALERQCIQAFPRLINCDEGVEDPREPETLTSNRPTARADADMQELYKRLYNGNLEVRNLIEILQACKTSDEPHQKELFACMIHGLFDEFTCFHEYPLEPLATTAVLFGGIIRVGLITDLTLRVGLGMVLESVRDYTPETSMYKFGLQALLHFLDRLVEWPQYCAQIVRIPGLRGTEAHRRAVEVVRQHATGSTLGAEHNGVEAMSNGLALSNGDIEEYLNTDTYPPFQAVRADPLPAGPSETPDDETQEKVIFFFNNVSEQNLPTRINQLQEVLKNQHFPWLARFMVEDRAKVEPNFQPLYLDMLGLLDTRSLWDEVLRETYVSIRRMLNTETTNTSQPERNNLKSLGTWVGLLTLARDKPIKHNNISFKDLLIEAYETQRLVMVIPFVCNVLVQGTKSTVFKPPNPWITQLIALLVELYQVGDIKLNQKFAIEVLCQAFGMKVDSCKPSTEIRDRSHRNDDLVSDVIPEGPDGFEDMAIGNINRSTRNPRFSPSTMVPTMQELELILKFPPPTGSPANQTLLHHIVLESVHKAIVEIIVPVVERSVTIASIATANLIHKDFEREPDEERLRTAAHQLVKQLSGSLAHVTCKEPLRVSMTGHIRQALSDPRDLPEHSFPEGSILMCVNDNLDIVCNIVEKQAEERSMPDIDANIETELERRRRHVAEHPNEPYPYGDRNHNEWARVIPDPFKQTMHGLNQEQLSIYYDFARQPRGTTNHTQSSSADTGRQLPDVLQEPFAPISTLPTPLEPPAVPYQPQQQTAQMLPPPLTIGNSQPARQAYTDGTMAQQRLQTLIAEICRLAKEHPGSSLKDLDRDDPLVGVINQIWEIVSTPPNLEQFATGCAYSCIYAMLQEPISQLGAEAFAQLLRQLCHESFHTQTKLGVFLADLELEKLLNFNATISLLKVGLLDFGQLDDMLSKMIQSRQPKAVDLLSVLIDNFLFADRSHAMRTDFANSLGALSDWLSSEPSEPGMEKAECLTKAEELMQRLREWGSHENVEPPSEEVHIRELQMAYIFDEWVRLCAQTNYKSKALGAFLLSLHQQHILESQEDMLDFLHTAINRAIEMYEQEGLQPRNPGTEPSFSIDCLARFIVLVIMNRRDDHGSGDTDSPSQMESVLSLITLIMNDQHKRRGSDNFNQRAFFRLFSSILYDWDDYCGRDTDIYYEMLLALANNFLVMQPQVLPGFTYGWLTLVSHRLLMPNLLKLNTEEVSHLLLTPHLCTDGEKSWDVFADILEAALSYVCNFLRLAILAPLVRDLYQGILRILLILHHDFPEFLADNHYRLCNIIPPRCAQLRNLVLSAYPSSLPELPDPFKAGLKVDRLDNMRKNPIVRGITLAPVVPIPALGDAQSVVEEIIGSNVIQDEQIGRIVTTATRSTAAGSGRIVDSTILHALILYIGTAAIEDSARKSSPIFTPDSIQATLLNKLSRAFDPETRFHFLAAIANQLRYPNSHTHYFSSALLHLFGTDMSDPLELDVKQQITRVLLERLVVHRPHPWGLIITLLELLKNPSYAFWDLPFIKAAPEVDFRPHSHPVCV